MSVIVTHTRNAEGQRRIYFGGKASVECWIEPEGDGGGWCFRWMPAVTGQPLSDADLRAIAEHTLRQLADELAVASDELSQVSFDDIAALHTTDPFVRRRMAQGRRRVAEQGFVAAPPPASAESPMGAAVQPTAVHRIIR